MFDWPEPIQTSPTSTSLISMLLFESVLLSRGLSPSAARMVIGAPGSRDHPIRVVTDAASGTPGGFTANTAAAHGGTVDSMDTPANISAS